MKYFNTTGLCKPDIHYMLSAANRLPELQRLIDQQLYFVIHAPRQVGKTTLMLQLAGCALAAWNQEFSMEGGVPASSNPGSP